MTKKDYYEVLEVKRDSKAQEIKKSYYNLALQWHPDKHHHKEEAALKFNEIREAYSVLIDPDQRKIYDKYGHKRYKLISENQDFDQKNNIFFKKGFQGTQKSAFDVLWDILLDDPEEFSPFAKSKVIDQTQFPNIEVVNSKANFSFDFFDNSENKFGNQDFFDTFPFFETTNSSNTPSNKGNNNFQHINSPDMNSDFQSSFSNEAKSPLEMTYSRFSNFLKENQIRKNSDVIIIEDDEKEKENQRKISSQSQFIQSFSDRLQQFQSFLNDFDKIIEENLSLSSNSKKIIKTKKITSCSKHKYQNENFHTMPVNFIPFTSIPI